MAKIGIMGGTFDPVHIGHLVIAQSALTSLELDKIWFMPAGDPPHKGEEVTDKQDRLNMLSLAIKDNPDFKLFTYETDKERPSYSAVTMAELDERYPDCEFYFIMGADSLLNFDKWYQPETICAHTTLVAANRNNVPKETLMAKKEELEEKYRARILLLDTPQLDISSSDLRQALGTGKEKSKSIRYSVPEPVYDYISKRHLYSTGKEGKER